MDAAPHLFSLVHHFTNFHYSSITASAELFIHVFIDSHNLLPNPKAAKERYQGTTAIWRTSGRGPQDRGWGQPQGFEVEVAAST